MANIKNDPVKPKVQTTKAVKVTNKPKKQGSSAFNQFKQGIKDSFKPIVDGMKTVLPSKRTKEDFVKGVKTVVPSKRTKEDFVKGVKTVVPSKRTKEDFVKGVKTVVPKSKNIRKSIESSPEYKAAKGVKKAVGYKTGGMVNPNASVSVAKVSKGRPTKSTEPKSATKKATGKTGGISKAPKTAKP